MELKRQIDWLGIIVIPLVWAVLLGLLAVLLVLSSATELSQRTQVIVPLAVAFFSAITISLSNAVRRRDHARSRRHMTMELMKAWLQFFHGDPALFSVRSLISTLPRDVLENIENRRPSSIPDEFRSRINQVLEALDFPPVQVGRNGLFILDGENLIAFRSKIIQLVNYYEYIASGYAYKICDQEMFYNEFYNVFCNNETFLLRNYIEQTNRYPALKKIMYEFADARRRQNLKITKKNYL